MPASYVTPNPSIHLDPYASQLAQMELRAAFEAFRAILGTLPGILIQGVVNAILRAFGLSQFEGPLDQLLVHLEQAMGNIPAAALSGLQDLVNIICYAFGAPQIPGKKYSLSLDPSNSDDLGYWLAHIPATLIKSILNPTGTLGDDVTAIDDFINSILAPIRYWLLHGGAIPSQIGDAITTLAHTAIRDAENNPVVVDAKNSIASGVGFIHDQADGTAKALGGLWDRFDGTVVQAANSGLSEAQQTAHALADAAVNGLGGVQTATTEFGSKLYAQAEGLFQGLTGGVFNHKLFGFADGAPVARLHQSAYDQQATLKSNSLQLGGTQGLSVSSVRQALQRSGVSNTGGSSGYTNSITFSSTSSLSDVSLSQAAFPSYATYYQQDLSVSSGQVAWTGSGVGPLWQSQTTYSATTTTPNYFGPGNFYSYYTYVWNAYLSSELVYNPTPTTSNYQVVDMVLTAANQINSAGTLGGVAGAVPISGFVYLVGRLGTLPGSGSTQLVSCVYAQIGNGFASLVSVVNGSRTVLGSIAHNAITGATYELVCGNPTLPNDAGIYQMSLYCNGVQLLGGTANSGNHFYGSAYRLSGFGAASVNETLDTYSTTYGQYGTPPSQTYYRGKQSSTFYPATIGYWGVQDNTTPAAVGSGFQVAKVASVAAGAASWATGPTATGSVASWVYYTLPAGWFDTINAQTSDFSWSTTTNTVTVSISGWYLITVELTPQFTGSANYAGPGFLRNGVWSKQIPNFQQWGNGAVPPLQSVFNQYLSAGDTITPVMAFAGTPSAYIVNTDTTGGATNFSVTLMNCGTLS